MTKNEKNSIFRDSDGRLDVDVSKISTCKRHSLVECECECARYYFCNTVAYAGDLLVELENENKRIGGHSHEW